MRVPVVVIATCICACAHARISETQPEIVSSLSPHIGFVPTTVNLIVRLHGTDEALAWSHCAQETWEWGLEGLSQAEDQFCEPWAPGTRVRRTYERRHYFHEPGDYNVNFYLGGRLVASEPVHLISRTGP